MGSSLDEYLGSAAETDLTATMLRSVFAIIPYAPPFAHYASVDDAARALGASTDQLEAVRKEADKPVYAEAMTMARIIDAGDLAYTTITGITAAYKAYHGDIVGALETDPQQRNDAVAKALALAWMAERILPGPIDQKVDLFRQLPAGKAIAMYYTAIEIALPFADNVLQEEGFLATLFEGSATSAASRVAAMAGGTDMGAATAMLRGLTTGLERVATHVAAYARPIAKTAAEYVPGALTAADAAAGAAAAAADLLPVYTVLGTRLVAEAAAHRVIHPS
jgi:hypothetical protein